MHEKADFPFAPRKAPWFYGWTVLFLGSFGVLFSIPGQTVGVSVFTDFLIDALGVSRVQLSLAYLCGTLMSAFTLSHGGKLYDRLGARKLGAVVIALLGIVLILMARIETINLGNLSHPGSLAFGPLLFLSLTLGFFSMRFLGQGMLTLTSRNMVMKWFDEHRGMANAFLGTFTAFGFSYAPRLLDKLITQFSWQGAWNYMGLFLIAAAAPLFWLLSRDNPRECGLKPDGNLPPRKKSAAAQPHPARDLTLKEAQRTRAFWALALSLSLSGLYITAMTFHVVDLFARVGMTRVQAVAIFLPSSVIAVGINFLASWLSDNIKLKYFLWALLLGIIASSSALAVLGPGLPVILLIVFNGCINGVFSLLTTVSWPRYFGLTHLGAISGRGMSFLVAGSAVGPYLFSLSESFTSSYRIAALICCGMGIALFALALKADPPVPVETE